MDSLECNIPYLVVFKSLPCLSAIFSIPRMKLLIGILISNACIHGTYFTQLLDLISLILHDSSDSDLDEIFHGTDVIPLLFIM